MRHAEDLHEADAAARAWAASGAMSLTGWPDERPLGPPAGLVPAVASLEAGLRRHAAAAGRPMPLDAMSLLGERAAMEVLHRQGQTSCGGATRLLRTADGWMAVSLARVEDRELLPAWLGLHPEDAARDPWDAVQRAVAPEPAAAVVERGASLGLPVAELPVDRSTVGPAVRTTVVRGRAALGPTRPDACRVVDLSSLWAGPLCTALLAELGAEVVKVESTTRPDGARGRTVPSAFFALLNAGKRSVALDLGSTEGRAALRELVGAADLVVEASRPRALRALGVDAHEVLATSDVRAWVSITGHGREGTAGARVGFGDDAAVAGGLVAWDSRGEPVFCADAVADPLAGLTAAVAALDSLADGGRRLLDVSMAGVAAGAAGPTAPVPEDLEVVPPRARVPAGPAPDLGADTAAVLADVRRRGRP